jgi:Mg2+ and Co2+ transporter CorA
MTFLAIFSAFFLPLTLITSFYWMNIKLPFENTPDFVYLILFFVTFLMIFAYLFWKNKQKF